MALIRKLITAFFWLVFARPIKTFEINALHVKLAIAGIIPRLVNREESVNPTCFTLEEGKRSIGYAMTYTPQHVANFFLDKAEEDGIPMSPLKLLKLVYIAYGWVLALKNEKLFDEPIEAWQHGPVIPSLYHEFKHYRSMPISARSEEIDLDTWDTVTPRIPSDDEDTNLILNKVWTSYRRFKAWDLRNKTHEEGGPWHKVYAEGLQNIELRDQDIRDHYVERIAAYLDAAKKRTTSSAA
jgi:uncharacterized phage-associated protein